MGWGQPGCPPLCVRTRLPQVVDLGIRESSAHRLLFTFSLPRLLVNLAFERVPSYTSGWLRTQDPLASSSGVLGLQVSALTLGSASAP